MGNAALVIPPECIAEVLKFLPWRDRQTIGNVCRSLAHYTRDPAHWRWMCFRLNVEEYVYVQLQLPPGIESWREHFLQAFKLVDRWRPFHTGSAVAAAADADAADAADAAAAAASIGDKFNAQVVARLRPLRETAATSAADANADAAATSAAIVIPLHQRLQMLRAQYRCSSSEALRMLWERHGRTDADPWAQAALAEPNDADPANTAANQTRDNKATAAVSATIAASTAVDASARVPAGVVSIASSALIMCLPSVGLRQFQFNHVFDPAASQASVFARTAEPLVQDFINGTNCTLFSYGQTGSGKTHTMFGPEGPERTSLAVQASTGLVGRTCARVLAALRARRALGLQCELAVSYIEVFGDNVANLIEASASVGTWHGVAARVVIQGRVSVPVNTEAEMEAVLEAGERFKRTAATAMNEHSSRAHSLLFLHLKQTHQTTKMSVSSQFCLADLGGSEQVSQSHVTGSRLTEAININQGLFALKNCVLALVRKNSHVPFQQSRLTSLLQTALSGQSKMVVVVTGSMDPAHTAQTAQAMLFGEQCQSIEAHKQTGATVSEAAIEAINKNLARLEEQIRNTETWATKRIVRIDPVDGREEVMLTTVPVGAEHLRVEFEKLLQTRRFLLGQQ